MNNLNTVFQKIICSRQILTPLFIRLVAMSPSPTKERANSTNGMKPGAKKGNSRKEISKDVWYAVCVKKNSTDALRQMTNAQFLKSAMSGTDLTGTRSEQVSFGKYLKKYQNGELKPTSKKRSQKSKYKAMEDKLVNHHQRLHQQDKSGISWILLKKKLLEWASLEEDEIYKNFEASPGFISRVLKDHNLFGVSLKHGKAKDVESDESVQEEVIDDEIDELDKKEEEPTEEDFNLSDNDPMDEDIDGAAEEGKEDSPSISFLEAIDHIETLQHFGTLIGVSSKDLDQISKFELSLHWIQLFKIKARSQPMLEL